jgi:hypothetical protein
LTFFPHSSSERIVWSLTPLSIANSLEKDHGAKSPTELFGVVGSSGPEWGFSDKPESDRYRKYQVTRVCCRGVVRSNERRQRSQCLVLARTVGERALFLVLQDVTSLNEFVEGPRQARGRKTRRIGRIVSSTCHFPLSAVHGLVPDQVCKIGEDRNGCLQ